jgi:hypothetical protein
MGQTTQRKKRNKNVKIAIINVETIAIIGTLQIIVLNNCIFTVLTLYHPGITV